MFVQRNEKWNALTHFSESPHYSILWKENHFECIKMILIMKCAAEKTLKMRPGVWNISCPVSGKLNIEIHEI